MAEPVTATSFEDFPLVDSAEPVDLKEVVVSRAGELAEQAREPDIDDDGGDFGLFPLVDTSKPFAEQIKTIGRSFVGAAIETVPAIEGALVGARVGARGGVVPAVAGGVAGFIGGLMAGGELREAASDIQLPHGGRLVNPSAELLPEEDRAAAFAGEVLGGGAPFAAVPIRLAKQGVRFGKSFVGRQFNRILDTAKRDPKAFLAAEAAALTGASTGSAVAQIEFPDQPLPRFGAEVAGGLFNPSRIIIGNGKNAVQGLRRFVNSFSQSGRENTAARQIASIIENSGEDPLVIAEMLERQGLVQGLTAAQKTGNKVLADIEKDIARQSAKFGVEAQQSAKDGLASISQMIIALRGTGDPAAIQAAAELQVNRFKTILSSRIALAENEAAEAAGKITTDTAEARTRLSTVANEALGNALSDARKVENGLWEAIPLKVEAKSFNTVQKFQAIRAELLPEEKLPAVVEGFVKRMEESGGKTSTGELIKLRKRFLALARQADAKDDFNDARIFGQMAESILDDMDAVFTGPNQGILRTLGVDTEAYDIARGFSRELHETFTQTFAGQSLQTNVRGADRIPPELMLKRAFATGPEATTLKLRELEEATNFLPTRNLGGEEALQNHNAMIDAQERLLRLAAADAEDPITRAIDPKKLQKFITQNEELMDRFPQVGEDLQKAVDTQIGVKDIEAAIKGQSRIINDKTAFTKLADIGNPVIAIDRIISGKNPVAELNQLAKIATKSGPSEVSGLQATIWDHALAKATSSTGDISMGKFKSALFDPMRPGEPSLMTVMQKAKIITTDQVARTEELFGEINKIATAMQATGGLDNLIDAPGALVDLILSIAGSRASTIFTQGQGMAGASLIAAGRGASAARNIFAKVPAGKTFNVIQEAARNPEFMAMLLRKTTTQAEAIKLNQQIHSYLWQAGLISDEEESQ